MAKQLKIESKFNGDCPEGYLMITDFQYNNILKKGEVKLSSFENEEVRNKYKEGKRSFGDTFILINDGEIEVVPNHEMEVVPINPAMKKVLVQIDIADLTPEIDALIGKIYQLIDKKNIKHEKEILELAKAINC